MDISTGLYPQICSFENLFLAYRKARKGKRKNPAVASFEFKQEEELVELQQELLEERWKPGAYHSFILRETKQRLISAAPFRDRVVHHAICNIIEPIWEKRFIFDSYANRAGKGTHRAILRCNQFARRYKYVLQCDVEQFFPSIDHAILLTAIERYISCVQTMNLIAQIIQSGNGVLSSVYHIRWFPGDDLWAALRPRGTIIETTLVAPTVTGTNQITSTTILVFVWCALTFFTHQQCSPFKSGSRGRKMARSVPLSRATCLEGKYKINPAPGNYSLSRVCFTLTVFFRGKLGCMTCNLTLSPHSSGV